MSMTRTGCFLAMFLTGCAHQLEIVNADKYRAEPIVDRTDRGLVVAIVAPAGTETQEKASDFSAKTATPRECEIAFLHKVARLLSQQAGYKAIATSDRRLIDNSDVQVKISYTHDISGRGINFLKAVPGAAVFTHVWAGFSWDVKGEFQISIVNGKTAMPMSSPSVRYDLDARFTDSIMGGFASVWFLPIMGQTWMLMAGCLSVGDAGAGEVQGLRKAFAEDFVVQGVANEIIRAIGESRDEIGGPKATGTQSSSVSPKSADRIRDLDSLLKAGVITEDEYRAEMEKLK